MPEPLTVPLPWHPLAWSRGDEAGRSPLAGPVAGAVILDDQRPIAGLADKKLSGGQARGPVRRDCAHALCFSIAEATVQEID